RDRPEAEMEALRALFADLMRGEQQARSRLERLQQQIEEAGRVERALVAQLEVERESRSRAEAQAMDLAAQLQERMPGAQVATDGGERLRSRIAALEDELAAERKRFAALEGELSEERGKARALAERAAAEVEWARDRARAATTAEQE